MPEPIQRKEPCYEDDSGMPFGKHRGELLQDVPASYLLWLWEQKPLSDTRLENYIHNSMNALKQECPDRIVSTGNLPSQIKQFPKHVRLGK